MATKSFRSDTMSPGFMDDLYGLFYLAFHEREGLGPTVGMQEPNVVPRVAFRVGTEKNADEIVLFLHVIDPDATQVTWVKVHL